MKFPIVGLGDTFVAKINGCTHYYTRLPEVIVDVQGEKKNAICHTKCFGGSLHFFSDDDPIISVHHFLTTLIMYYSQSLKRGMTDHLFPPRGEVEIIIPPGKTREEAEVIFHAYPGSRMSHSALTA